MCRNVSAFLWVLFVLLVSGTACASESQGFANDVVQRTKTIRCGYVLYPPYLEKDLKTGKLQGISYDLFESLASTLHISVTWAREIPVGAEIAELDKGGLDAICGITGAYDANMFTQLTYSDYLFVVRNKIYARADDVRFNGRVHLADLDQDTVKFSGIEGDTSYIFPQTLFSHAKIVSLPALSDTTQLFQDVKLKKADLLMVEGAPAMKALIANPGVFKELDIVESLPTYAAQIAFLKKDVALRDTFNEVIRFMKLNGQLDPILQKYDPNARTLVRAP